MTGARRGAWVFAALLLIGTVEASLVAAEGPRLPRPRPAVETAEPSQPPMEAEESACLARLRALGVTFSTRPAIEPGSACAVPHPLKVSALGGSVEIAPEAILNCRTTEALARWTKGVLIPAADELLGAQPTLIGHSSTYVCRPRYGDPDAKLSEHATANAVDIASIAFADRGPLAIRWREPTTAEGLFQLAIREGSCRYFTTVLGPRTNEPHGTHLHFDMAERESGYGLCDLAETNVGGVEP